MLTLIVDGDPLLFRCGWGSKSLNHAFKKYEKALQDIKNCCFNIDSTKIAVFGDSNFRVAFCPKYKSGTGRKKAKEKNPNYFLLRKKLVEEGLVTPAHGMEADDLVRIWAEEEKAKGNDYIIASIDKDLHCIEGTHYLIHRDAFLHMSEDEADLHYWTQVLTGDSVDDIPGLWMVGPVKAGKILEGATTSKERKQRVIDAYYDAHGVDWKENMMHTGTLIHIMRTPTDMFSLQDTDKPSESEDG